jgi:nitrogen fixation protein NifZ
MLAEPGTRWVLVNTGHRGEDPARIIYLVRLAGDGLALGPPTGCWAEELRAGGDGT